MQSKSLTKSHAECHRTTLINEWRDAMAAVGVCAVEVSLRCGWSSIVEVRSSSLRSRRIACCRPCEVFVKGPIYCVSRLIKGLVHVLFSWDALIRRKCFCLPRGCCAQFSPETLTSRCVSTVVCWPAIVGDQFLSTRPFARPESRITCWSACFFSTLSHVQMNFYHAFVNETNFNSDIRKRHRNYALTLLHYSRIFFREFLALCDWHVVLEHDFKKFPICKNWYNRNQ